MNWLLLLAPLFPLALALSLLVSKRPLWRRLAPWAAAPALLIGLFGGGLELRAAWLGLGLHLGLDLPGRALLLSGGLLWLWAGRLAGGARAAPLSSSAGAHDAKMGRSPVAPSPPVLRSRPENGSNSVQGRGAADAAAGSTAFWVFHLAAMAGFFGLALALDPFGFLSGFGLLTLAVYGLIVQRGDAEARRTGLIYVVPAVLADALLFEALLVGALNGPSGGLAALLAEAPALAEPEGSHWGMAALMAFIGFGIKAAAFPLHVWLGPALRVLSLPTAMILGGLLLKAGVLGWLRFLPLGETALPDWGGVAQGAGLGGVLVAVVLGLLACSARGLLVYAAAAFAGLALAATGAGLAAPDTWGAAQPWLAAGLGAHVLALGGLIWAAAALEAGARGPRLGGGLGFGLVLAAAGFALFAFPFLGVGWGFWAAALAHGLLMLRLAGFFLTRPPLAGRLAGTGRIPEDDLLGLYKGLLRALRRVADWAAQGAAAGRAAVEGLAERLGTLREGLDEAGVLEQRLSRWPVAAGFLLLLLAGLMFGMLFL